MLPIARTGLSFLAVAIALPSFATTASAQRLYASCNRAEKEIHCDVHGSEAKEFDKFTVTRDGDRAVDIINYEAFAVKNRSAAYHFIVQTGPSKEYITLADQLLKAERKRTFGLTAVGDKYAPLVDPNGSASDVRKSLGQVKKEKVSGPALYEAIFDAGELLDDVTASRKAIVIVGDGTAGKTKLDTDKLFDDLRKANIVIYTINTGQQPSEFYKRLASDADGVALSAGSSATATASQLYEIAESGGLLRLSGGGVPGDTEMKIAATLKDANVNWEAPKIRLKTPTAYTFWEKVRQAGNDGYAWAQVNKLPAGAIGVMAAGLLLAGFNVWRNRRGAAGPILGSASGSDADDNDLVMTSRGNGGTHIANTDTVVIGPTRLPEKVYAWLQFLDATSTRVPIGATNVRIGRHKDNDICLENNSVHRQHAVLHMAPDKKFIIQDLGTTNGVVVNSQRISQKELSDGDLIELGEVRARFFANPAVLH